MAKERVPPPQDQVREEIGELSCVCEHRVIYDVFQSIGMSSMPFSDLLESSSVTGSCAGSRNS